MSPTQLSEDSATRRVRMVTLGCARNEVDSEELAGRLAAGGWQLAGEDEDAAVVVVNTCGFIQAAKQESIDVLLSEADRGTPVVAAGCLAERYGAELAGELPEAQVISFDDYADIAARLDAVAAGQHWPAHQPRDRRTLLPLTPVDRPAAAVPLPGHGQAADLPAGIAPASGPRVLRRRLGGGPVAPLKIASGCDRRCTFCAIPAFRGSFVSRPAADLIAEAGWLAGHGARELLLVSENSTSYGKDLGDLRLLERLLPQLAAVPGIARVRVSYLQPAEVRPGLIEVLAGTPGVARYFDLSFQHASGPVLRSMRRFGDARRFLELIGQIRALAPEAGIRSNFITGFPGESEADVAVLQDFLAAARLDAVGIFGYSDEDGTAAADLPGQLPQDEVDARVSELAALADELMAERAAARTGSEVDVLIDEVLPGGGYLGRAEHQAPEVDGAVELEASRQLAPGEMVRAVVTGSAGVDLTAVATADAKAAAGR